MGRRLIWAAGWALAVGCNGNVSDAAEMPAQAGGQSGANQAGAAALDAGAAGAGAACAARSGCNDAGVRDASAAADAGSRDAAPSGAAGRDAATTRDAATADASSETDAGPNPDSDAALPGWTLTFQEEFDGPEGTGVDTSKWTPVDRGDGFGNNELQFYTPRTENARMDGDGSLIIEAREEDYMGRGYTSARLESSGKFEQAYGRFEIRARVPFGQGIWPAFWLLGNDIGSVSWPQCGEIDILEQVGRTPSTNYGSLHGPGYSGGNPLSAQYQLPGGARFADDFHDYAIEWEPDEVRWYVDGNLYHTRTPGDVPSGGEWVYDHPFFLILNVAVGGAFPGSPDDSTEFPQRLLVDYVRVYEREP
jgi:beta-glucanase (GH16 family)